MKLRRSVLIIHIVTVLIILLFFGSDIKDLIFAILLLIISCMIFLFLFHRYQKQIQQFSRRMHDVAKGNFDFKKNLTTDQDIHKLNEELDTLIQSIQNLTVRIVEEQVQKELINSRQKDVELKMLASQINPHFLYNTLETIRMKARIVGQYEIEDLVKMLAKILRRNIQVGDNLVSFRSEVELIDYYLKIQSYRFGERISYEIKVDCDISGEKIMPLLIQPIVENAYVHGLEAHEGPGHLFIHIEKTDQFKITVTDNGDGIPPEKLKEIHEHLKDMSLNDQGHIGLSNVNQRIKLRYGSDHGIHIESNVGIGTTVTITLPIDMSTY